MDLKCYYNNICKGYWNKTYVCFFNGRIVRDSLGKKSSNLFLILSLLTLTNFAQNEEVF